MWLAVHRTKGDQRIVNLPPTASTWMNLLLLFSCMFLCKSVCKKNLWLILKSCRYILVEGEKQEYGKTKKQMSKKNYIVLLTFKWMWYFRDNYLKTGAWDLKKKVPICLICGIFQFLLHCGEFQSINTMLASL